MPDADPLARFRRRDLARPADRAPRVVLGLLVVAALLALWGFWVEPSRLVERHPQIAVEGLPPMTVALLSDVHAGCSFVDRQRIGDVVARINAAHPDVIALLGDYMTEGPFATPIPPEVTAALLGGLRAPSGVFAILGNHDNRFDGARVARAFTDAGIRVMDVQSTLVTVRGRPFTLVGIPDESTLRIRLKDAFALVPPSGPVVALTHSPEIFPESPRAITLLLAGHTHGGQLRLPLIGSPFTPTVFGERFVLGHVIENGHHLYITTGLGTSVVPFRLGVPPEIVVLHINGG